MTSAVLGVGCHSATRPHTYLDYIVRYCLILKVTYARGSTGIIISILFQSAYLSFMKVLFNHMSIIQNTYIYCNINCINYQPSQYLRRSLTISTETAKSVKCPPHIIVKRNVVSQYDGSYSASKAFSYHSNQVTNCRNLHIAYKFTTY